MLIEEKTQDLLKESACVRAQRRRQMGSHLSTAAGTSAPKTLPPFFKVWPLR